MPLSRPVSSGPRRSRVGRAPCPFATQHLSGGGGGLEHVLAHLGPPMVDWWRDLGHPELTPELIATLVAGVRDEFAGRDETDVIARRDLALRELMAAKARLGLD
jgi:carnitine 3-dehydrogenase